MIVWHRLLYVAYILVCDVSLERVCTSASRRCIQHGIKMYPASCIRYRTVQGNAHEQAFCFVCFLQCWFGRLCCLVAPCCRDLVYCTAVLSQSPCDTLHAHGNPFLPTMKCSFFVFYQGLPPGWTSGRCALLRVAHGLHECFDGRRGRGRQEQAYCSRLEGNGRRGAELHQGAQFQV